MERTKSRLAQASFNLVRQLQHLQLRSGPLARLSARIAGRIAQAAAKKLGRGHTVVGRAYGQDLVMPAEHFLPVILAEFPRYNQPLALAVEAIAKITSNGAALALIDVGANIGDTVVIVEQRNPGRCSYLCIESDPDMVELCRFNHAASKNVQVEQAFVGEQEGTAVWLQDDGRANPSTRTGECAPVEQHGKEGHLQRLDSIALPFAELQGKVSLIKVDTEGYDFSVLRSGRELLRRYKPGIFLEWYPELLEENKEKAWDGLEFLQTLGYRHFVFYTNQGDLYCRITDPDRQFLSCLVGVTRARKSLPYFDVFLSTTEPVCEELVKLSIAN